MAKHRLSGSEREALPGARATAPADPQERLQVSLQLRRRNAGEFAALMARIAAGQAPAPLDRAELESRYGAAPEDIAAVEDFARQAGLDLVRADAAHRTVVLSGTVRQLDQAFGVKLQRFEHPAGAYRGRTGPVYLPKALAGIVEAVLGLDNRPQARAHFRLAAAGPEAAGGSFTPTQLATLYQFPQGSGQGQCIAIIELGGGYETGDLAAYFSGLGLAPPQVTAVSVDQAANQPGGDPGGADGEVMLDIEVAGAIAPQASLAVYFAPNTDAGFLDAINSAIHDSQNQPSVISISWGGPESSWTQQALDSFDQAFQSAAALGITVCVAAGDGGSGDGVDDGAAHVDFPASSPHVLACGGTSLVAQGGAIVSEVVWNDGGSGGATGGGVSGYFTLPAWQSGLQVNSGGAGSALTMRGVPDVAADADPQTGYAVRVDGTDTVIGGTSAVAPLWAGLVARLNSLNGAPLGLLNPRLYQNPAALNDIAQGNNGAYAAAAGWDACTGLGTPDGTALAGVL